MKIHYISDTHIDFWIKEINPNTKQQKQIYNYLNMVGLDGEADVLVIAGDLGHYVTQDLSFLLTVKGLYGQVVLVPGNHDRYLVSKAQQKKYQNISENRILEMKIFCRENDIHYLDGNIINIEGYNFGGVGMSWDKSFLEKMYKRNVSDGEVIQLFNDTMNDSKLIFGGTDNYYVPLAYGGREWVQSWSPLKHFEEQYEKLQKITHADVMVTHYTPVNPYEYVESKYGFEYEPHSTFYMFDGYKDVERINPKHWIFGHMHAHYEFKHENTQFHCNPLGYPGENTYTQVKEIIL